MTDIDQVVSIYRETQSLAKTAEAFGKSSYWVRLQLHKAHEPINPPTPRKFDTEAAQKLRDNGQTFDAIAKELGKGDTISWVTVRNRLHRKNLREG